MPKSGQRTRNKASKLRRDTTNNPNSVSLRKALEQQIRGDKAALVNKKFGDSGEDNAIYDSTRILKDWDDVALQARFAQERDVGRISLRFDVQLEIRTAVNMSQADLDACFEIVKLTSKDDYQSSSAGWNASRKKEEMLDRNMIYILIRATPGTNGRFADSIDTDIIAFASFKIDYDEPPQQDQQVLYIYEVHVGAELRGKGIGKFFLFTIECMAYKVGILKTMLTVFTKNTRAVIVYRNLGYRKDACSPEDLTTRRKTIRAEYRIMSKRIIDPSLINPDKLRMEADTDKESSAVSEREARTALNLDTGDAGSESSESMDTDSD
ncbi:hypothetical protein K458DRAFT_417714 [Lentithecium fluviatile CBS 122367]|uniref:N-alpha-acetyltransferase 40 n=1 Tax=Lentithecium fluviatile CBS 122367 TaxID=1168545 RepID=A0A6G1J3S4_9PLEO|nr:hypothetical protein K458DRAFT_417714 [Lentithecium fluviatile CBS 122367]